MDSIDISVVICTYNRADMLSDALKDMINQETDDRFSFEILVVDDGSTDNTRHVVDQLGNRSHVKVNYVPGGGNGYTHAMNTGVKESRGDWIAFFDDDQRAELDWLRELHKSAVKRNAQIVGGRRTLLLPNNSVTMLLSPVTRTLLGEEGFDEEERRSDFKNLPGGGNMLIKKSVFDKIGSFDDKFATGGCDSDFVSRALLDGFNVWWTPNAIVRHIIYQDRLNPEQIKWYSLQLGCSFALMNFKHKGQTYLLASCMARLCQCFLVTAPLFLFNKIRNNQSEVIARKALFWRAIGYSKMTFHHLFPSLYPSDRINRQFTFRKGRDVS